MIAAQPDIEERLIKLIEDFLLELRPTRRARHVSKETRLDSDLGLDSLDRVELLHCVEEAFDCHLSVKVYAEASTINDLINILQTFPAKKRTQKIAAVIPKAQEVQRYSKATTLVDLLSGNAEQYPSHPYIYLQTDDDKEAIISYGDLYNSALKTAQGLQKYGLKAGETVAIMLPTGEDFFGSFYGVLMAGGIPVPIYPPFRRDRIEDYVKREAAILTNARVSFLIGFPEAETLGRIIQGFIPSLKSVVTVSNLRTSLNTLKTPTIEPTNPALIQYTSGSTGNPKGVLLSHANIIANLEAVGEAAQIDHYDRIVSWLPLYHDMGLIGCFIGSLYFGLPLVLLSPLAFLSRPERWLWAIHTHRATLSAAPNFAFELCTRKIQDKNIVGLDLSSLRLLFNGAESVQAKTLRNFIEKFSSYGLKPETLFPVYGLAESTVALSFPPVNRKEPLIDLIKREPFEKKGLAIKAKELGADTIEVVSCGNTIPAHEIRIVDEQGNTLPERTVGSLWFRGPSSMQSYYRNEEATKAIAHDGWLDSGDYAYRAEEDVFICGRKKDVIIMAGRNLYPQDLEEIAARIPGIRKGCVIAFGVSDPKNGTEKLIIVAETVEDKRAQREKIEQQISDKIVADLEVRPDEIILVSKGQVPKTSSGKLQRSACKAAYQHNQLTSKRRPFWLQVIILFFAVKREQLNLLIKKLGRAFFTLYAGLLLLIFFLPILLSLLVTSRSVAQKLSRYWIKLFFNLLGWSTKIDGSEYLNRHHPMIYVANHTSYLDSLLLIKILAPGVAVVGKRELLNVSLLRRLIEKLDHVTVERRDLAQSLADLKTMATRLKRGQSLLIFPEGTFTKVAGLRPFKPGAFELAVETNTPICPIAINGTRAILPDESYLLCPGKISVTVSPPIIPQRKDWLESLRLRELARSEIARSCGEPVFSVE